MHIKLKLSYCSIPCFCTSELKTKYLGVQTELLTCSVMLFMVMLMMAFGRGHGI